jgi:hypothetical protein
VIELNRSNNLTPGVEIIDECNFVEPTAEAGVVLCRCNWTGLGNNLLCVFHNFLLDEGVNVHVLVRDAEGQSVAVNREAAVI